MALVLCKLSIHVPSDLTGGWIFNALKISIVSSVNNPSESHPSIEFSIKVVPKPEFQEWSLIVSFTAFALKSRTHPNRVK